MVKFINKLTGTVMLVADERAEEYKAAGHKPVAPAKPAEKEKKKTAAKGKK